MRLLLDTHSFLWDSASFWTISEREPWFSASAGDERGAVRGSRVGAGVGAPHPPVEDPRGDGIGEDLVHARRRESGAPQVELPDPDGLGGAQGGQGRPWRLTVLQPAARIMT